MSWHYSQVLVEEFWTDLKPLEMGKFQKWLELHGRY